MVVASFAFYSLEAFFVFVALVEKRRLYEKGEVHPFGDKDTQRGFEADEGYGDRNAGSKAVHLPAS